MHTARQEKGDSELVAVCRVSKSKAKKQEMQIGFFFCLKFWLW